MAILPGNFNRLFCLAYLPHFFDFFKNRKKMKIPEKRVPVYSLHALRLAQAGYGLPGKEEDISWEDRTMYCSITLTIMRGLQTFAMQRCLAACR